MHPLSAQKVGNALYGLLDLVVGSANLSPPLESFLGSLLASAASWIADSLSSSTTEHVVDLRRRLLMVLPKMPVGLCTAAQLGQWARVDAALASALSARKSSVDSFYGPPEDSSYIESRVYERVDQWAAKAGATGVRQGDWLLDCFEADVTFRVPGADPASGPTTINVEVDGPTHKQPTKKLFCRRRDAVLSAAGVRVVRVDVDAARDLMEKKDGGAAFDTWLDAISC